MRKIASWAGDDVYPGASNLVNLAVTPYAEKYVFSIQSNSTVSTLAFNSTGRELSFSVSGPTGTRGFIRITIAKDLVSNIADLKVYLDATELGYTASSIGDSWVLYFTYQHSTHKVVISLGLTKPFIQTQLRMAMAGIGIVAGVVLLLAIRRKRR